MKFVVIGTAGHIDHGKSSLVKALTGTDPDRLPEEREREITIDLGFAHTVSSAATIGFIDVPGHERFIRNMLAGIGGVDGYMMAVSAVEGIKEQTREHAEILRLLGLSQGIIAITKIDLPGADPEIHDRCREFFSRTIGGEIAIVGTSVISGEGMDLLRSELDGLASRIPERDATGLFRLTIDRVFSLRGAGTVVTGTAVAGRVRVGEDVEILPGGPISRIRQLEVYGGSVQEARAGQRVAMNLHGVEREELSRGQVAVAPSGVLAATSRFMATVEEVGLAPRPLRHGERVRVCAGSAEVLGRCYLLEGRELAPRAAPVFAEIRLEAPLLVLQGDPFILRAFSPVVTHGGGRVVDNMPSQSRAKYSRADLAQISTGDLDPIVRMKGAAGVPVSEIRRRTGRDPKPEAIERARASGIIVVNEGDVSGRFIWREALEELQRGILREVEAWHASEPLKPGIALHDLRARLKSAEEPLAYAIDSLVRAGSLKAANGVLSLPAFSVRLKDEQAAARARIEAAFRAAGRRPVELADAAQAAGLKPDAARPLIQILITEKQLVRIATDIWIHAEGLRDLAAALQDFKRRKPRINVAEFKDLTGTTRKLAIPLLEFLDRERLTRRDKDERIIA